MQATSDGKVIQEVFEEGKPEQLWIKGEPDAEDYFTIESKFKKRKLITPISERDLEIKGNITLRCINNCWLFTILVFLHIDREKTIRIESPLTTGELKSKARHDKNFEKAEWKRKKTDKTGINQSKVLQDRRKANQRTTDSDKPDSQTSADESNKENQVRMTSKIS